MGDRSQFPICLADKAPYVRSHYHLSAQVLIFGCSFTASFQFRRFWSILRISKNSCIKNICFYTLEFWTNFSHSLMANSLRPKIYDLILDDAWAWSRPEMPLAIMQAGVISVHAKRAWMILIYLTRTISNRSTRLWIAPISSVIFRDNWVYQSPLAAAILIWNIFRLKRWSIYCKEKFQLVRN